MISSCRQGFPPLEVKVNRPLSGQPVLTRREREALRILQGLRELGLWTGMGGSPGQGQHCVTGCC